MISAKEIDMTTKCKICQTNGAEWAMQFIGENKPSFYAIGWHMRGFAVTKICEICRQEEIKKWNTISAQKIR